MTKSDLPPDRGTGIAGVAAGTLLFVSVFAEIVRPVQRPDGSVTAPGLFAAYLTVWTLGAVALVVALSRLRHWPDLPRAARVGRRTSVAGAVLLVGFGVAVAATSLVGGSPWEPSFVLFGLGLLLTVVGHASLGVGLRRREHLRPESGLLVLAAGGALVAVLVFADPWHDLGLAVFDAAWVALGARLLGAARASGPSSVDNRSMSSA